MEGLSLTCKKYFCNLINRQDDLVRSNLSIPWSLICNMMGFHQRSQVGRSSDFQEPGWPEWPNWFHGGYDIRWYWMIRVVNRKNEITFLGLEILGVRIRRKSAECNLGRSDWSYYADYAAGLESQKGAVLSLISKVTNLVKIWGLSYSQNDAPSRGHP